MYSNWFIGRIIMCHIHTHSVCYGWIWIILLAQGHCAYVQLPLPLTSLLIHFLHIINAIFANYLLYSYHNRCLVQQLWYTRLCVGVVLYLPFINNNGWAFSAGRIFPGEWNTILIAIINVRILHVYMDQILGGGRERLMLGVGEIQLYFYPIWITYIRVQA